AHKENSTVLDSDIEYKSLLSSDADLPSSFLSTNTNSADLKRNRSMADLVGGISHAHTHAANRGLNALQHDRDQSRDYRENLSVLAASHPVNMKALVYNIVNPFYFPIDPIN